MMNAEMQLLLNIIALFGEMWYFLLVCLFFFFLLEVLKRKATANFTATTTSTPVEQGHLVFSTRSHGFMLLLIKQHMALVNLEDIGWHAAALAVNLSILHPIGERTHKLVKLVPFGNTVAFLVCCKCCIKISGCSGHSTTRSPRTTEGIMQQLCYSFHY